MSVSLKDLQPENFVERIAQKIGTPALHDPGILACVKVDVVDDGGKPYQLVFSNRHPSGPFIRIDTPSRERFLAQDSEEATEAALKYAATAILAETGGQFDIHPFYGGVWGTAHSTVAENFGSDSPSENLTMIINLSDEDRFSKQLTDEALAIGPTFTIPSDAATRFLAYSEATHRGHPGQQHHDTAAVNGLEKEWDTEFKQYNPKGPVIPVMGLSPRNIADLVEELPRLGLTPVAIPYVYIDEFDEE